ncbi:MAG: Ig-like domain-containing protein [Spirochaetes bacterium]|nr:Ig-like domain-containing protein [Spirochaetota bacterium]
MRLYRTLLFIIFILLISSCNKVSEQLGFYQPEIESVYPYNGMINVPADVVIIIKFSKDMDKTKTNNEFNLSSQKGQVSGYYNWSDNRTLSFTPDELLDETNAYSISISSSAEDADGNDLYEDYESVFYINTDQISPCIEDYVISYINGIETDNHTGVLPDTSITIIFSEEIDINTMYNGFSISPSVKGFFEWTEATSITFNPLFDLEYGTNYTVTLSQNIKDISGNQLVEGLAFNFTVGNDFEKPEIVSVRQDPLGVTPDLNLYQLNDPWDESLMNFCIEKQNDIVITFSEPLLEESVNSAISISPNTDFYVSDIADDTMRLTFIEPMESEEYYTLAISSAITDLQNNPLNKDYEFYFFTNSINSLRPAVEYITDQIHYSDIGLNILSDWTYPPPALAVWTFNETEPLTVNAGNTYNDIHIIFSTDMIRTSIEMTISHVSGVQTGNCEIVNPDWFDENLVAGGSRVYNVDLIDVAAGNVYKITVKGGNNGAEDINGNYMQNDFIQYIRFP